jgi:IS30 family transposase
MAYHQITSEERYTIAALWREGLRFSEIAHRLGRHRSTISREFRRNSSRWDGSYRPSKAIERTNGRRSRSRRNQHFTRADFVLVEQKLKADWSPEQISGYLRLHGELSISHETIYIHVWRDKEAGASCIATCAARQSSDASGTTATTAVAAWQASATSPSDPRTSKREAALATGRSTL